MTLLPLAQIRTCLNDTRPESLEQLARQAHQTTVQNFGRTISLYAPIYLSNYCSSHCAYCGFSRHHKIKRYKLTEPEMRREMEAVAEKGIENILLLTGESYTATPLAYLETAVRTAREFFSSITLEVHPMEEAEYRHLFFCGADGITLYQETYDLQRYQHLHTAGKKQDYHFRRRAPFYAAQAGMRTISLGVLLGLFDVAEDLFSLYQHLREMERTFPGVEYSLSFPRLQPVKGENFQAAYVDDITLIKIICLTRIAFPRVGINLSTRESARLRDHAIELGVTRLSAESSTVVGGYALDRSADTSPQFDIQDTRSVKQIIRRLKEKQFDPVLTDWRPIANETLRSDT